MQIGIEPYGTQVRSWYQDIIVETLGQQKYGSSLAKLFLELFQCGIDATSVRAVSMIINRRNSKPATVAHRKD